MLYSSGSDVQLTAGEGTFFAKLLCDNGWCWKIKQWRVTVGQEAL